MEELLDLPFQNEGVQEFMSICASALEICVTFPASSLFLVSYIEKQWIIHPPPSCLIFIMGFPPFWIFHGIIVDSPDQAEVATIGWRNFSYLLKK